MYIWDTHGGVEQFTRRRALQKMTASRRPATTTDTLRYKNKETRECVCVREKGGREGHTGATPREVKE